VLRAARLAEALERLARNDVRHRFVLDLRPGADPQVAAAAPPASAADAGGARASGDREDGRTL
jgi:uncharacterized zinc-type alcohol dehydrogenase-like protein